MLMCFAQSDTCIYCNSVIEWAEISDIYEFHSIIFSLIIFHSLSKKFCRGDDILFSSRRIMVLYYVITLEQKQEITITWDY